MNRKIAMPMFLDVDGVLLVQQSLGGAVRPDLVQVDLREAGIAHTWTNLEAILGLNDLVESGVVRPVFSTAWDDLANQLVGSAIGLRGLPYDVAVQNSRYSHDFIAGRWIKEIAIDRWRRENDAADAPFIMIDDLLSDGFWRASLKRLTVSKGNNGTRQRTQARTLERPRVCEAKRPHRCGRANH